MAYNCQSIQYLRETKMYLRDPMFEDMNARDVVAFVESVFMLDTTLQSSLAISATDMWTWLHVMYVVSVFMLGRPYGSLETSVVEME